MLRLPARSEQGQLSTTVVFVVVVPYVLPCAGGAVAADSHHVLRHLGITHILNATEEVALPPAGAGFTVCRVPLR